MTYRVMIDSMIYDALAGNENFRRLVQKKQDSGDIAMLSTRIQKDQIAAIPPARDIGQKSAARTTEIASAVFVLDVSRLDEDCLGSPEADAVFLHLQGRSLKHTADAMIGATAFSDTDILVTNDQKLTNRFRKLTSTTMVMTDVEFQVFLEGLN